MENLKIHAKILDFQNNVEVIKKDATNPHFKNSYASLSAILAEVKVKLNSLKCTLTQPVVHGQVFTIITDTESGEFISTCIQIPEGLSAQQVGSAITYFRRYTLAALLALEIDDDDGNATSQSGPDQKEWLNKYTDSKKTTTTEAWDKVVTALKSKHYVLPQVELKYKLTKELKAELEKL